mgnify:CR=1 FL=1
MKVTTKTIVTNGLMIALVFLATRFTAIPGPIAPGYINLGDVVIMAAAIIMGSRTGFIAGAFGSMLADIAYSAFIYAPITFIVKGLEGYVVGKIASRENTGNKSFYIKNAVAAIIGAVVMVAGYFLTEAFILSFIDSTFGYTYAISNLPMNLVQGGLSTVVGYLFANILLKVNLKMNLFTSI